MALLLYLLGIVMCYILSEDQGYSSIDRVLVAGLWPLIVVYQIVLMSIVCVGEYIVPD